MNSGRRATPRLLIIAALFTLDSGSSALASPAGSVDVAWRMGDHTERHTLPAGAFEMRAISNGALLASGIVLPADAPRAFIVRFGAPPTLAARRRGIDLEAVRAPYQRFLADLAGLESAVRAESGGRAASVALRRRFEAAFNGVAITASRALADRVRQLPYVTGVFPDDSVHALLDASDAQIRADSLRARLGLSGEGIVVSIIDTGVDYGHPALGGCFGPGCRVIGGYDFVNGDADPMDDHGHGTHVAGIVGGNGAGLTGVAPAVRFLAYKVLGASGGGAQSDVIAGIDRSLDPDGNPLTDDAADVINLSLGGSGDADGPLAQAVDEAVAAGVVCVVAAGNSGGYLTIGSPGCARQAITVGAVTSLDQIASFSSRGPAAPDDAIKPDVVAPGVGIVSTWPGGGSRALSGTSMATPHVAGVAALLRQLHPGWSPAAIKSALMNSAVDLGADPFQQGAGRIDALAAGTSGVSIQPASLSFGLSPTTSPLWSATGTVTLRNDAAAARVVTLSTASNLPPGSTVQVSPASVALAPGEARSVTVTLSLDHAPVVLNAPHAYSGAVRASVDGRMLRVPFAVLRTPQLVLRLDDAGLVIVHDRASFQTSLFASGPGSVRLFVPAGTYDVIAALGAQYRVVREGIVVADSQTVDLYTSNAGHAIERVCVDERGNTVDMPSGVEYLRHHDTGIGIVSLGGMPATMRFTTMGPAYDWEWHRSSYGQEPITYDFKGFQRGVSASAMVRNAPGDLRHVTLAYHASPGVRQLLPVRWMSDGPRGTMTPNGLAVSSLATTTDLPPLEPPFTQEAYFMSTPDSNFHFKSSFLDGYPYQGVPYPTGVPDLETPYLIADPGEPLRGYLRGDDPRPVVTLTQERMELGYGPPTWFGSFRNGTDALRLSPQSGSAGWLFLNQRGDWRDHSQMPFTLTRDGTPVESGSMTGGLTRQLIPGTHTLTLTHDRGWIDGQPSRATVTATFNTLAPDPDPPFMRDLSMLVNGLPSEVADGAASNVVRFTMEDAVALDSVALASRVLGTSAWNPLPLSRSGDVFEAALPTAPGGPLSLRIEATDASGNRLAYAIEPAVAMRGTVDHEAPIVTVTSPNGGESWASGSHHDLTWTATDNATVDSVAILASSDGGAHYGTIASGLANSGTFDWLVPATPAGLMRVKVVARDARGNTGEDASNANFSVSDGAPPTVALLSPAGGESWEAGSARTLTWNAGDNLGVTGVDLSYSTDGGATFSNAIAEGIPNTGSYTWSVPAAPTATARVRIIARDAAGNTARDSSRADWALVENPDRVGNGGFESNLAGWSAYGSATLTQTTEGHTGTRALRIRGSSSSSFGCDDLPNWITAVAAKGAIYRITAWVKTPASSRGKCQIRVYEYVGSRQQGSTANSSTVTLSATWALLTMDYTVRSAGASLSVRVVDSPATSGETFLVDDVSIKLLSGAPPPDAAPIVSAPAAVGGTVGAPVTFLVNASDADGPAIAALTQAGKPVAATFSSNSARTQGTFTWTPAAADVRAAPYVIVFTASNTRSGADTASITVAAGLTPANLCANGTFESGTSGWGAYGNSVLTAVPDGRSGNALQVTGSSSFGADDIPDWVPAPLTKNAVYRIGCWVKGVGSAAGNVKIRVYEFLGTSQQGSTAYSPAPKLTASWQQLTVDYTVRTQGSYLSIRITDAASSSGESFLIDDVAIEPIGLGALAASPGDGEQPATQVSTLGPPLVFAASFAPNPVRTEGTLSFTTTRAGAARVDLFDVNGRHVRSLLDESALAVGPHRLRVDWHGLAAGLYLYRIRADEGELRGRLVLLR